MPPTRPMIGSTGGLFETILDCATSSQNPGFGGENGTFESDEAFLRARKPRAKTMISYAQNWEDVILDRPFAGLLSGFYVDVGAYDPCENTVTRHFYENGWRGINIEPGPMFDRLVEHRPRDINLRLAASNVNGSMTFVEYPDELTMSGLATTLRPTEERPTSQRSNSYEVEVRRLRDILAEHAPNTIEFMSVDVEGHEREVLLGNDWERFRPRVVVVEATLPNTSVLCNDSWEGILLGAGYQRVYFDGINCFYLRDEDRSLAPLFRLPPNVFDDFRPCHMVNVEGLLAAEQHRASHLQGEFDRATFRAQNLSVELEGAQGRANHLDQELADLRAGTGARSLRIGLAVARWITKLASLRHKLPRRKAG